MERKHGNIKNVISPFINWNTLKSIIESVPEVKPYKCKGCDKSFTSCSSLRTH